MGWRSKTIFLLIIYFAGFATAIYMLAPTSANAESSGESKGVCFSAFKSDEFAISVREGIDKCLGAAKNASTEAGRLMKEKFAEKQLEAFTGRTEK